MGGGGKERIEEALPRSRKKKRHVKPEKKRALCWEKEKRSAERYSERGKRDPEVKGGLPGDARGEEA